MKKTVSVLLISAAILLASFTVECAWAQTPEPTVEPTVEPDFTLEEVDEDELLEDLDSYFRRVYLKSNFSDSNPNRSYRFPSEYDNYYDFYDPLEMTNFPHETLGEGDRNKYRATRWSMRTFGKDRIDWGLYEVGRDTNVLHQMIYLPSAAATSVYYGRSAGREGGTLKDFYLYADFYVSDVYPADGGSCFLTYSNSLITGFNSNKKMVLNIGKNIEYRKNVDLQLPPVENPDEEYRYYGYESDIAKSTELVVTLPDEPCVDTECYAVGNDIFPNLNLDRLMLMDLTREKAEVEAKGLKFEPKIYRVEIIRIDGVATFYVNGSKLASVKDGITEPVSWGAGPVVYPDGRSSTCNIGTFVIMGK